MPHMTIESHPDNWGNILTGIAAIAQLFIAVEPYIIQLIDSTNGNKSIITINPPKQ